MIYPFCRSLAGNQIEELPAGVFSNNNKLLNLWVGRLKVHSRPTYFYCHILLQILVNSQILKYYCTLLMSPATIVLREEPYLLVHFLEYHNIYLSATGEGPTTLIETISKPRRRRQRGHGKTIAQHVRFKKLTFLSRPMQKKQREITTICVVCEPKPRRQIVSNSIWNSTLLLYVMLKLRCDAAWDGKHMQPFLKF